MSRWTLLLVATLVPQDAVPEPQPSREATVADGETVTLKLAVSNAGRNLVTAMTMPGPVTGVVSAWDAKDLSVEHEGAKLFLKLLAKSEGYLDVTMAGGAHVRLRILPSGDRFDSHVTVKVAAPVAGKRVQASNGALDLIRAMRMGEAPSWATVARGGGAALLESAELKASLLWTYDTGRLRGLVIGVTNPSATDPLEIDVTRFQADGLVLVGARELSVRPGGSTRLYLVLANR